MDPSAELDQNLSDGVVAEKLFVERLESEAQHSQEVLDEDDAFLGSASPEVWEYEVVDARADEFEEAIENSDLVLEYDVIDTIITTRDEATAVPLEERVYPLDGGNEPEEPLVEGSGVRGGDDGPAGMPTVDPSAGGMGRGTRHAGVEEAEGAKGIDETDITTADDPRLGLTDRGEKPAEDWAANTGPTRDTNRKA